MSVVARGRGALSNGDRWLGHWICAIPILLIVTALSARQLDLVVPEVDEFYFMYDAGMISGGPYSPFDVLASVARNNPNHTPLYFILLNLWGHLVGNEIALLRVLTVFTGLLSLAMIYRLARDFVAPFAGLLALVAFASNAFFNFYYANARLYPLLLLAGAITFWLYLRLCQRERPAKTSDYLALTAACYMLANTHVFSVLLFVALGAHHLLHVRKDARWLRVALAVSLGLLLFSPWISVLLTGGIERTFAVWQAESDDPGQVLAAFHAVGFNGSMVLLLATIAGMVLGWRQRTISLTGPLLISLYFLVAFCLVALISEAFGVSKVRFTLGGWPVYLVIIGGGLYGLYRWRSWLMIVVLLWPLAGMEYQQIADWSALFRGRERPFQEPAWHIVSRLAQRSELRAPILTYLIDLTDLHWPTHILDYPQSRYYFADRGLDLVTPESQHAFKDFVIQSSIVEPLLRVFYQGASVKSDAQAELVAMMESANYQLCERQSFAIDTVLDLYGWRAFACQAPQALATAETDLITTTFYGAKADEDGAKVFFVHDWNKLNDFAAENFRLSHQLISADWENVAQVDLPLVDEGMLRQFSIDVSEAPAGSYRLVAILYNRDTGDRFDWIDNRGNPPFMLTLAEVEIPA